MARTTRHVSYNIEGILQWSDKELRGLLIDTETKKPLSAAECREYLQELHKDGHRVLPIGEACEGYDKVKGCPGQPKPEMIREPKM